MSSKDTQKPNIRNTPKKTHNQFTPHTMRLHGQQENLGRRKDSLPGKSASVQEPGSSAPVGIPANHVLISTPYAALPGRGGGGQSNSACAPNHIHHGKGRESASNHREEELRNQVRSFSPRQGQHHDYKFDSGNAASRVANISPKKPLFAKELREPARYASSSSDALNSRMKGPMVNLEFQLALK